MRHFCTYFDRNYLVQGLTLYRSLARHASPFALWVLCLDDKSHQAITRLGLENLRPVRLSELEAADPVAAATRSTRSLVEYYFTLSPVWPLYLLDRVPQGEVLTYLDSDLLFYSSPEPLFAEMGDSSVLIVGHRFPEHLRQLESHGVYNVGLIGFRNDARGRRCLERWREQCIAWCYDRVEDDKFADQKYLDAWPRALEGVHVARHKGVGVAPWNWSNHPIHVENGSISVGDEPLIFYHFQGLKIVNRWLFQSSENAYGRVGSFVRRKVYGRYLRELQATREWLRERLPAELVHACGSVRRAPYTARQVLSQIRRGFIHPHVGRLVL